MKSVQALEIMGKLKEINGFARLTLGKVLGIRANLVRIYKHWQECIFPQVANAFRKWTTRNPRISPSPEKGFKRENAYQTNDKNYKLRECVYCGEIWA